MPGTDFSNCTVGFVTLGCKVNQYETEAIAERFAAAGFSLARGEDDCDITVINTCTVTSESDRKARQMIRRAIQRNPNGYILVTGCLTQTSPEQVAAIAGVDFVCGNTDKQAVVEAAKRLVLQGGKNPVPEIFHRSLDGSGFEEMSVTRFDRTRAYIKIEDGCENRCAYCIIPAARGPVRSKRPEAVLEEVRALVAGGCREVVLTGIETASYGRDLDGCDLADLLAEVDRVEGLERVRLGSLDPSLMKQEFVDRIAGLRTLTPHFHLSMQSGSDTVLARMKRKYNSRMALEGMERLRRAMPRVQFTTDMIVGFPQETDAEFSETLDFARRARFLMIHVFRYSRRAGTVAAAMSGQVPEPIKAERSRQLSEVEAGIRREILDGMTGRVLSVLFEDAEGGRRFGHTPEFIEVSVPAGGTEHGAVRQVRIEGNDGTVCNGTVTEEKEN